MTSDPESESESESESEPIRSPESESESELEQYHRDSAPLVLTNIFRSDSHFYTHIMRSF